MTNIEMHSIDRVLLSLFGNIVFVLGMVNGLKIEQIAGYYECTRTICEYDRVFYILTGNVF